MTYTRSVYPAFYSSLSGIALFHASPAQFPSGPPPKAAPAFSNHCPVILAAARGCSSVGRAPPLQGGGQEFESSHLHFYDLEALQSHPLDRCHVDG